MNGNPHSRFKAIYWLLRESALHKNAGASAGSTEIQTFFPFESMIAKLAGHPNRSDKSLRPSNRGVEARKNSRRACFAVTFVAFVGLEGEISFFTAETEADKSRLLFYFESNSLIPYEK